MANGWQPQDIEENFNTISSPIPAEQSPVGLVKPPMAIWRIITISVIGVVVVSSGIYFASQTFFKSEEAPKASNEISDQSTANKPTETATSSKQPAEQTEPQEPKTVFADKLISCTKYKTTFNHPLTGEILEKEVLGIINGKCNYVEQMPNGGKMECKYSESERVTIAQYYKDVATAESIGVSVHVGSENQQIKYTINGKEVASPLQEAVNSGICIISGY